MKQKPVEASQGCCPWRSRDLSFYCVPKAITETFDASTAASVVGVMQTKFTVVVVVISIILGAEPVEWFT
jgi:hypothetical protein